MNESHTSKNLADNIKSAAIEWKLENKVGIAVSDNAANIVKAITEELQWKHFGCYAHTLNLIVQNGLQNESAGRIIRKV